MKRTILILLLNAVILTQVKAKSVYTDYQKQYQAKITKFQHIRISETPCQKTSCLAKQIIRKTTPKILNKVFVGPGGVNPTSPLCRQLKGQVKIFYLPNHDAISACLFNDGSFLLTWDLLKSLK